MKGVMAWDTFAMLAETAKKLGVTRRDYIHIRDRICSAHRVPALADLMAIRTETCQVAPWL